MGTIYDAFHSAKSTAANIPQPGEQGSYTIPAFLEDFPQFCQEEYTVMGSGEIRRKSLIPETMLQTFVDQANDSVLPSMGEYVAVCSGAVCSTFFHDVP